MSVEDRVAATAEAGKILSGQGDVEVTAGQVRDYLDLRLRQATLERRLNALSKTIPAKVIWLKAQYFGSGDASVAAQLNERGKNGELVKLFGIGGYEDDRYKDPIPMPLSLKAAETAVYKHTENSEMEKVDNEDFSISRIMPDGTVIAFLGDGMGGYGHAEQASRLAAAVMMKSLAGFWERRHKTPALLNDRGLIRQAFREAVGLAQAALNRQLGGTAAGTTAVMAFSVPTEKGDFNTVIMSLGDTPAYVLRPGQPIQQATAPDLASKPGHELVLSLEDVKSHWDNSEQLQFLRDFHDSAYSATEEQADWMAKSSTVKAYIGGEIGSNPEDHIVFTETTLQSGDSILLASDGISFILTQRRFDQEVADAKILKDVPALVGQTVRGIKNGPRRAFKSTDDETILVIGLAHPSQNKDHSAPLDPELAGRISAAEEAAMFIIDAVEAGNFDPALKKFLEVEDLFSHDDLAVKEAAQANDLLMGAASIVERLSNIYFNEKEQIGEKIPGTGSVRQLGMVLSSRDEEMYPDQLILLSADSQPTIKMLSLKEVRKGFLERYVRQSVGLFIPHLPPYKEALKKAFDKGISAEQLDGKNLKEVEALIAGSSENHSGDPILTAAFTLSIGRFLLGWTVRLGASQKWVDNFTRLSIALFIELPVFILAFHPYFLQKFVDSHFREGFTPDTPENRAAVRASIIAINIVSLVGFFVGAAVGLMGGLSSREVLLLGGAMAGGAQMFAHLALNLKGILHRESKVLVLTSIPEDRFSIDVEAFIFDQAKVFFALYGWTVLGERGSPETVVRLGGGTFGSAYQLKVRDEVGNERIVVAKTAASDIFKYEEQNFTMLQNDVEVYEHLYQGRQSYNSGLEGIEFPPYYGKVVLREKGGENPLIVFMGLAPGKSLQKAMPKEDVDRAALAVRLVQLFVHFRNNGLIAWDPQPDSFLLDGTKISPIDMGGYENVAKRKDLMIFIPLIVRAMTFYGRSFVPSPYLRAILKAFDDNARYKISEKEKGARDAFEQAIARQDALERRIASLSDDQVDEKEILARLNQGSERKAQLKDLIDFFSPSAESLELDDAGKARADAYDSLNAEISDKFNAVGDISNEDLAALLPALVLLKKTKEVPVKLNTVEKPEADENQGSVVSVRASGAANGEEVKAEVESALAFTGEGRNKGGKVVIALKPSVFAEFAGKYEGGGVTFVPNDERLKFSNDFLKEITKSEKLSGVSVVVSRKTRFSESTLETLAELQSSSPAGFLKLYLLLDEATRMVLPVSISELSNIVKFQRLIAVQA